MALINFATTYSKVSDKLSLPQSDTGDYIKLYFTKDGHIITHGTDYIPWGNGIIPINRLPVNNTVTNNEYLWDSKTIADKISQAFSANDAMRFKGTIGLIAGSTTKFTINGTEAPFPSGTALVGDTYRVVTAGMYANMLCEVGDLLICITSGSTTKAAEWTVSQTNINGQIYHTINGISRGFYSNDSDTFSIYAPSTAGTLGQVLISQGENNAPEWRNQSTIIAGDLDDAVKKGLFTTLAYSNDVLTVTIGGTTKTATIAGHRVIQVNSTEILGSSSNSALNLVNGVGTSLVWDNTLKKLIVNTNTGYTTDAAKKNYAVQVDANNQLYVNVPWSNTVYDVVSKTNNGLAPKVINTNKNLITQAYYLLASPDGQATPSWYKLPTEAFANTWRTIKIGGTSIGNKSLNFMPSGDIYVKVADQDATTEDEFDIGFGIAWYNIDTGKYEYE